jgi:TonB family protein
MKPLHWTAFFSLMIHGLLLLLPGPLREAIPDRPLKEKRGPVRVHRKILDPNKAKSPSEWVSKAETPRPTVKQMPQEVLRKERVLELPLTVEEAEAGGPLQVADSPNRMPVPEERSTLPIAAEKEAGFLLPGETSTLTGGETTDSDPGGGAFDQVGLGRNDEFGEIPFRDLSGGYQVMPTYPISARREGREGTVLLKVQVLETGAIGKIGVERSSGSSDLDEAALNAVRRWRFEPAAQGGRRVRRSVLLPIKFALEEGAVKGER